jgi:hypothetical protein
MPPLLPHVYKLKYFSSFRNFEVGGLFVIPTNDKTSSFYCLTFPSSPPLFSSCNFDPSNANHIEDVPMSFSGFSPNVKDDKPIQPKVSIKKKNYDATRNSRKNRL